MGALLLPSERFARFGNPAWPGDRAANFAVFVSWPGALPKNAESLRNSDALMRVAVPRRRGPVGLRIFWCFDCPPVANALTVWYAKADKQKVVVQKALDEAQLLFDSPMQKYLG